MCRFLDSNGRKQQVTYEADARGYRVKTRTNSAKDKVQPPETRTEVKISQPDTRSNDQILAKEKRTEATRITESIPETITEESVPLRDTPPHPVPEVLLQPPPAPIRQVKLNDEPEQAPNGESSLTVTRKDRHEPAPQGIIKFKDARNLQSIDELGYYVGYPFLPGNFVYAL